MVVDDVVVGQVGMGVLVLVGIAPSDGEQQAAWMARKLVGLRIFDDDEGRFNRSLRDVGGSVLAVSQFTLFADARKGTRPSFIGAADPAHAEPMYERFCDLLADQGVGVQRGTFGAHMDVELVNDGPVTIVLERE